MRHKQIFGKRFLSEDRLIMNFEELLHFVECDIRIIKLVTKGHVVKRDKDGVKIRFPLGDGEDRFPVWGSMRVRGSENRPKPPVEESQLVDPHYAKFDNVFIDP